MGSDSRCVLRIIYLFHYCTECIIAYTVTKNVNLSVFNGLRYPPDTADVCRAVSVSFTYTFTLRIPKVDAVASLGLARKPIAV